MQSGFLRSPGKPLIVAICWITGVAIGDVRHVTTSDPSLRSESGLFWVYFKDKGPEDPATRAAALEQCRASLDARTLARREARRTAPGLVDERDLPVCAHYVRQVQLKGAKLRVTSRWLDAISIEANPGQIREIGLLPFVDHVAPVRRGTTNRPAPTRSETGGPGDSDGGFRSLDYGWATDQNAQINLIALHDAGFTGAGVRIGILDTGFELTHSAFRDADHPLKVVAAHDFINDDGIVGFESGDPYGQFFHGTWILGTIGAYKPGELVGGAFDAEFILCKTEDLSSETPVEEDYYVAGLEFAESNGADVCTSSLGYIDWYTQADLDGRTAVTTIGVNIATENGVVCVTAAGNSGHDDDPRTSHLIAPADALRVLTCGAVYDEGNVPGFSSDGPTADGRVKPELLARGVDTISVSVSDENGYDWVSGTSLSTPLLASVAACLVQAHPDWTVDQLRGRLMYSATDYVTQRAPDPSFVRGYGIADAYAAHTFVDCNGDSQDDLAEIQNGGGPDVNGNFVPDACEHLGDLNCSGAVDFDDIDAFVLAVTGRDGYLAAFPECEFLRADTTGDFDVNFDDIDGFVSLLLP